MRKLQIHSDKVAIGLSLLCMLHCLALPLIIVLLPSLVALYLNNEAFHLWMVLIVIPISVYALTVGCKRHKQYQLLVIGLMGLTCLIVAVAFGESFLGESWEKVLTTMGAMIITYGHYKNYRLC